MLATLAQTYALIKLLIEKGVITDAEFKQKLLRSVRYISGSASRDAVTTEYRAVWMLQRP
jgi:hypothetical protein